MGAINRGVWPAKSIGQALFFYGMFCLSCSFAWSSDTSEQRVAAIISSGDNSMVLIENGVGEQNWHRVGEFAGDSRVDYIDPNWIRLSTPDGDVRLYLRGDKYDENERRSGASTEEPPREVSRNYDFRNLISRVDTATADVGGVSEQARARNLNEVFDLAERAKITAINKVEVSTAAEAGAELREQLLQKGAIRITVDNAYTKVLYVSPEP